jgi:uncharacterized RDD family membrane protein YckC
MDTDSQMDAAPEMTPLAATWRRWLAFFIDWIILSLAGTLAGTLFFAPLAQMGVWTRVLGFAIATIYFGVSDSGWAGAASPGKKLLSLRVVDQLGHAIGIGRSLLRAALVCAPLMLNGTYFTRDQGGMALYGLLGGWSVASIYVLAFNQRTKQGLHDLATRTFVMRGISDTAPLATRPFWRPHLVVAALFLVVAVPVGLSGFPIDLHFSPGTGHDVTKGPATGEVEVLGAWINMAPAGSAGPGACQSARVVLKGFGVDNRLVARTLAQRLIAHYHCEVVADLPVRLQYGFDLGFASTTAFHDFVIHEAELTHSP